jgi:hypothetical protein
MTFVPGPIIIPRKPKEKPEGKREVTKNVSQKREKKLVYVLIKLKPEQMISEKAKELEGLFGEKSFNRVVNPDEYTLLMNAQNLFSKSNRLYVVELTDGMNRWFISCRVRRELSSKTKTSTWCFSSKRTLPLKRYLRKSPRASWIRKARSSW